jgi:hypothetical protein
MTQSSFPFLFSSSFSCHRLVTLITILLINPLPIIYGAPIKKSDNDLTSIQRHKRQIYVNDDSSDSSEYLPVSDPEIIFEGLIGCKYDEDICNQEEACFDDNLFGQCWNGEGSIRSAFTLKSDVDELSDDKLIAIEYTLDFLNRYQLNWRDYMTQCILSHILSDEYKITRNQLELFYNDCLEKDEVLDELEAVKEENIYRRQLEIYNGRKNFYYADPYSPTIKSDNVIVRVEKPYGNPLLIEDDGLNEFDISPMTIALAKALATEEELKQINRINTGYIDSKEQIFQNRPSDFLTEESIMTQSHKVSVPTNEVHPGLVETLQINNNKQLLPVSTEEAMSRQQITNNDTDTERYFTVETSQGYIIIDRDFKGQLEGADLLALLAQIHSWPMSIFTNLNADRRILTFHVANNRYQINASSVASEALNNQKDIETRLGIRITDSGIGNPRRGSQLSVERQNSSRWTIITLVTCGLVLFTMAAFALLYYIKRNDRIRNKLAEITHIKGLSTNYYQDLCRQRMQTQPTSGKSPEIHKVHQTSPSNTGPTTVSAGSHPKHNSEGSSTRSSTSSWSEEPVAPVNMDIMTGHLILSYMEDHQGGPRAA